MMFMLVAAQLSTSATARAATTMPAPAFSGVTVDGKPISSASLKGKAYIVNFFASWCPPCRAEIPDMVKVQQKYASRGFTFVGVAVNEKVPNVRNFMKQNGMTWPVLMATPALIRAYDGMIAGGITGIPTSFVVDASGRVTGAIVGPRSLEQFERIVNASLRPAAAQ